LKHNRSKADEIGKDLEVIQKKWLKKGFKIIFFGTFERLMSQVNAAQAQFVS